MYVKDYGTCSQRRVDQDPPPSYYLTGSCREHKGLCQREGGHTGQGAGKSDVTTEFSPVPNCMILSKTEGKSKPFKISPDSEDWGELMNRKIIHIFGLFVCLFGFITQNAKRLLQLTVWLYSSYLPKRLIRSKILSPLPQNWEKHGKNIEAILLNSKQ